MGILDKAVEKYGERQLDQAQEELAELIVAISIVTTSPFSFVQIPSLFLV